MYFSTTCKPVTSLKAATKTQRPHSDNGIQIGAQIRTQITLTAIETLRDLSIAPSQGVASTTLAHCHLRRNGAPVHWRIFQADRVKTHFPARPDHSQPFRRERKAHRGASAGLATRWPRRPSGQNAPKLPGPRRGCRAFQPCTPCTAAINSANPTRLSARLRL
jgi:hypothetical protein